ncbi:MAG: efflux RND transporter periplasmic adaptor subunit [Bacteroidales bacterium]|nr:efflux RND transporter periplasmic adaptor subunit [Bacteroidales bacterium]
MKTLIKILPILLFFACSTSDDAIKKKIIMKKEQIAKIEQQIIDMEKTLSDTTSVKRSVPVEIKEIKGEQFDHHIIVYGNVEAENYALINPEMNGQIRKIHVEEGQRVAKGQLLISLNTDAIENSIKGLESSLDLVKKTFEKQKSLWDQNIGSEIQYLQAKSQKESLEAQLESQLAQKKMSLISAPFDGYVNKVFLKQGEYASPMMPLVEVVNLNRLIIKADVSENYLGKISKGQPVDLSFSSLPDLEIETPIVQVSKVIDKSSRTFQIELNINNRGEKIKPNMVSTIQINDFSALDAIVIPSLVIKKDITGDYVYVAVSKDGKTIVEKRYVKPTLTADDQSLIVNGLNKGDRVIVKGYHLVSSGVEVDIRN